MTFEPTKISDYEIVDEEGFKARCGIAYAGDPGAVLATLVGNDVIVNDQSDMTELDFLKAMRKYTGKNLLQCKQLLEQLKQ